MADGASDATTSSFISGRCLKPLKKRDVLTLRSWKVTDDEYVIVNFSVKHPVRPPPPFTHTLHTHTAAIVLRKSISISYN